MDEASRKTDRSNVKQLGADAILVLTTAFWGLTYILVKDAIGKVDVFVFLAQRFILSFIPLLLVCLSCRGKFDRYMLFPGVALGVLLFTSYAATAVGLQYVTATNSSFLVSLHVILVPFLGALLYGETIPVGARWGAPLCLIGIFFLCTNGAFSFSLFGIGEPLMVLGAVAIAFRIIFTDRSVVKNDIYWLTCIQIGTVAALSFLGASIRGCAVFEWHPEIAWALGFCALLATIFAFLVLNSVQRYTAPVHVSLILCMEPVFASLFGYVIGHETLTAMGAAGAGLVLLGVILPEIPALAPQARGKGIGSPAKQHTIPGDGAP